MKLYYSDTFDLPLPEGHRFPMAKYRLLRERIEHSEIGRDCQLLLPPAASNWQLTLVHTHDYVARVVAGKLSSLEQRRIGFPWSQAMVERSRRSTGASIAAARSACDEGIACNLAGGTHHSFAHSGQGYCVFNDTCVAAKTLQSEGRIQTALVIDCDVHQGNGTAAITKSDETVFALSVHCDRNYPFQKTDGDLDVALPAGTGDAGYLAALQSALDNTFSTFEADLVFYLAGADPYCGDRLGKLNLSKAGLRIRDEMVIKYCRERRIPLAISMAGGYAPDVGDIVEIHFSTIAMAYEQFARERSAEV